MITEHGWEPMTDKQALDILKNTKMTIGRQNGKTMFQSLLMEAMGHAVKALEEKVEEVKKMEAKNCPYCNEPADVDVTVGYTQVYCPRYSCDMPYMVVHPDKEEAVKAWNKLVEQITKEE